MAARRRPPSRAVAVAAGAAFLLLAAGRADAYVGPGAGFVLAPLFVGLLAGVLAVLGLLAVPFLLLWNLLFGRRPPKGRVRRVVVVGLDGLDPVLVRRFMKRGLLPNLSRLADEGQFSPLAIPVPSISPSSWSSFMTGADASRHRIYDFLTRDPCTCAPMLSSVRIDPPRRTLRVGKYAFPLGRPRVRGRRGSRAFWHALSDHRVPSAVLRVPITFPPEKFRGVMLSGMCVPDLRGTQGSFSFFTTAPRAALDEPGLGYAGDTGGMVTRVTREGDVVRGRILGPANTLVEGGGPLAAGFEARLDEAGGRVLLLVGGERLDLVPGEYSPWVRLTFRPAPLLRVHGIARFLVTSLAPEFGLYVTPIQIDPEKPALPISHPLVYSVWLARRLGPFATLGLAEDTWALNEGVLTEEQFLAQALLHHREREEMLFTALATTRRGCVAVVFDAADRVQHMFFRHLDPRHPGHGDGRHADVIPDLYARLDALVGRVRERLSPRDALLVLSDHGFTSFRRGVNLNAWLRREGYLVLRDGASGAKPWLEEVDWSRTRAFALGLTGLYLNRRGREARGVVAEGEEARALAREIAGRLEALVDPVTGRRCVRKVYLAEEEYDGPYRDEAPDLFVGYARGYRNSWGGATGVTAEEVVSDNRKAWSGDHCVDPKVVPGVLFADRHLATDRPRMTDVAPTILDLLGVAKPAHMTGRSLLPEEGRP